MMTKCRINAVDITNTVPEAGTALSQLYNLICRITNWTALEAETYHHADV